MDAVNWSNVGVLKNMSFLIAILMWLVGTAHMIKLTPKLPAHITDPPSLRPWCKERPTASKYPELFQTKRSITKMIQTRVVDDFFQFGKIKARHPFPGVCFKPDTTSWFKSMMQSGAKTKTLPKCYSSHYYNYFNKPTPPGNPSWSETSDTYSRTRRQGFDPCCSTKMSMTVPDTVVSRYTGQTLQVKHLRNSFQFLHEGGCESPGASCGFEGECRVNERMQWILVETPSGDQFVPVGVGNNCFCG